MFRPRFRHNGTEWNGMDLTIKFLLFLCLVLDFSATVDVSLARSSALGQETKFCREPFAALSVRPGPIFHSQNYPELHPIRHPFTLSKRALYFRYLPPGIFFPPPLDFTVNFRKPVFQAVNMGKFITQHSLAIKLLGIITPFQPS